jgi:hypothetical protein
VGGARASERDVSFTMVEATALPLLAAGQSCKRKVRRSTKCLPRESESELWAPRFRRRTRSAFNMATGNCRFIHVDDVCV